MAMEFTAREIARYAMKIYRINDSKEETIYKKVREALKTKGINDVSYWEIASLNKSGNEKRVFDSNVRDEIVLYMHDELKKASSEPAIREMISSNYMETENDKRRRRMEYDNELEILDRQLRDVTSGMSDEDAMQVIWDEYTALEEKYDVHPDDEGGSYYYINPWDNGYDDWEDRYKEELFHRSFGFDLLRFKKDWRLVWKCDNAGEDITPEYTFAKRDLEEFDYFDDRDSGARICKRDKEEIIKSVTNTILEYLNTDEFAEILHKGLYAGEKRRK